MKELSKLATAVQASTTIAVDAKFKEMRAQGINVIGFSVGEPDFPTPERIKQAGIRAIENNQTKYAPTPGTLELRQAICKRMEEEWKVHYAPREIAVNAGAKHILYVVLKTLVDPGDEVILPAPYWVSYYEQIKMVGGVPVVVETTEESGFQMSAEQLRAAITPKTKALILNNPSNPTGMMYDLEGLQAIAKVCVEEDIYVIADEIYDKLTFDGRTFTSFPSLGQEVKARTILINGVSKTYAMTGWRIGFAAADEKIIQVISNYLSHCISGAASMSQAAAVEAFAGPQDEIEEMRRTFEVRRDYLYDRLSHIPGVHAVRSEATFYMLMNIEALIGRELYGVKIQNADDFAQVFLEKGRVALVPCTGFGAPHYLRWSFAVSMDDIIAGADRLEAFLKDA